MDSIRQRNRITTTMSINFQEILLGQQASLKLATATMTAATTIYKEYIHQEMLH
jgi:hypothetical protein